MFPDYSFDTHPFRPMTWQTFREKVLLPEAGTRLIQEDMPHLRRHTAIDTMRKSQELGAVLHPGADSPNINSAMSKLVQMRRRINNSINVKEEDKEISATNDIDGFQYVVEDGKEVILLDEDV